MARRTYLPLSGAVALAALVVGPGLLPGFVLLRDMVFVPAQALDLDALGLGGGSPRAVPVDGVVGLLTALVPGDVLQKIVLLGALVAASVGAGRLVPPDRDGVRGVSAVVAGVVYLWNPYVAERLALGQWTLVVALAALPWVVLAAQRLGDGGTRAVAALVVACLPACLTPTGALLAGGVAAVAVGRARGVALLTAVAVPAALSAPWIVAGLTMPGGTTSDPAGVAAFAARAEAGGLLLTVLGGGGVWNADAVPAGRTSPLVPVLTVGLVVLALVGLRSVRSPLLGRLVLLGLAGLALAVVGAVEPVAAGLRWTVAEVPGAGLLRDGQKWVAWWLLPLAVGVGLGARHVLPRALGGPRRALAATLVATVLTVPDLAWGVGGRFESVDYPAEWHAVAAAVAADPVPGDVLVLPPGAVRAFGWNGGRPVLDPAPRVLGRPTIVDDTLVVGGVVVRGEDRRTAAALSLADDPDALARAGVGWVLVERGTPGPPVPTWLSAARPVVSGPWLDLVRLPDPSPPVGDGTRTALVVAAHALAGAIGLVGVLWRPTGAVLSAVSHLCPRERRSRS